MLKLPSRPDLAQLRRQAKDLLRAAKNGDHLAAARIRAVSSELTLSAAQLAVAGAYGFTNWAELKAEVERREILTDRDLDRLAALLAENPGAATAEMRHWCDHPLGPTPLSYVAMLRYDTGRGVWRDVPGTGAMVRALLRAGAPVDGEPGDSETPLITAASYGDAAVARELIEAGAALDATATADAGGVPGGTALRHAAVFGMTEVVDVLIAAGARVLSIAEAAAAGDVTGWLRGDTPEQDRVRALVMAADHQRLDVIDQLLDAGTPIDAVDPWDRQPLRLASRNGRAASVEHLLARGADPAFLDAVER
ncbi:ankyrin repeat domain-containing protein [Allokutzneria sp. A3M-2-11 16]|uniref:ankyrin repeat domain-containing protein n=1 Tax=Allokutzneria sp. A3M-2-11 16 TaxID=2962043 RepID=UPI0020B6D169|nr:ankyrin repeat domain-containing protein [Allokutzneria sp. A3M-2-11 16]MCP3805076.1 ankyrin repeat domain-containing protein [Allokutzneria sp. A3M-2-11 16]